MSPIQNASATGYDWFKSSYSSGDNNCIECADIPNVVPVRDSKNAEGPALTFSKASWGAFVASVKTETYPSI